VTFVDSLHYRYMRHFIFCAVFDVGSTLMFRWLVVTLPSHVYCFYFWDWWQWLVLNLKPCQPLDQYGIHAW